MNVQRQWTRLIPICLLLVVLMFIMGRLANAQEGGVPAVDQSNATTVSPEAEQNKTEPEQAARMSLLELLMKGQWFMLPIGACSLLGFALIIERFLALRQRAIIPPKFIKGLNEVLVDGHEDRDAALEFCHASNCPMARVAAAGIRKLDRDESSIEQAIEDAGANEVAKLRRNLRMLFGISSIAPMLGLLGTVWGMIEAFQVASTKGLGQAEHLARGIYEALVTTFAGLCVAIPILVFYYFFMGKIETIVSEMNDVSMQFIEHCTSKLKKKR